MGNRRQFIIFISNILDLIIYFTGVSRLCVTNVLIHVYENEDVVIIT